MTFSRVFAIRAFSSSSIAPLKVCPRLRVSDGGHGPLISPRQAPTLSAFASRL
jgi:hypothetical protein